ncbi:MAG: AAA family ATPase [Lachnospiraceae bacterium]|nr:AAA family ATPase [Lachnospiraceae bacterium]
MEFTRDMQKVMERAVKLARDGCHRYFMPEHMIYGLTFDEEFSAEYESHGGDIEKLKADILGFVKEQAGESGGQDSSRLTVDAERVLRMAEGQARASGRPAVDACHLLAAVLRLEESYGLYYMAVQDVDLIEILGEMSRESISRERPEDSVDFVGFDQFDELCEGDGSGEAPEDVREDDAETGTENDGREKSVASGRPGRNPSGQAGGRSQRWRSFLEDMKETSRTQNPLIGREEELERTIQILCRKDKNNVLHIGEPGVGKTALAYGLARKILRGEVPEPLKNAGLYALDLGGLLAGTQYRGDFEKRFKEIMEGLSGEENPILYLDEIHNIVGAGAVNGGSLDVANLLKPYLAAGHIRFIGATTYEEYKKHFSASKSLARRFQNVDIAEPTREETVSILKGLKSGYEKFHGVRYGAGVLEHAAEVSSRYINERFLPDKAIDLIDEAGAYRRLHPLEQKRQTVNKALIDQVLSKTCRIPAQTVEKGDTEKLAVLDKELKSRIFGQDEAVDQVVNAVKFSRAGLNDENKPVASFLFVGPTGVGKTELARVLASELGISFIRFDMSEYAEKHTVAKLIGAPAGYVGYEEGGLLTEEVRRHPHAVLLLDEIEKAHGDIFNVLLQVMDYATLTDNQGRKADFRNIILIMTSNAGAGQLGKSQIGFGSAEMNLDALMEAVKRTFQPEFRNRLSRIVLFHGMDEEMAARITEKKLKELAEKLAARKVEFHVSPEAAEYVRKAGITREYGAREIDRVISGEVKPLLAELLLFGKLKRGGACTLECRDGKLKLES